MDCSVLVPVLDEERYIAETVVAIRAQRFDGTVEFIFSDGGSADRTRRLLAGFAAEDPRIRVFDNPGRTVTSGLNVALSQARGRWVARMDAHTVYPDRYLQLGVDRLRAGNTRWVSGPQVPAGADRVSRAVAVALGAGVGRSGSRKWGRDAGEVTSEFELDTGVFCGVWARETLLEFGGWDERWNVNEDSEMAARFLARGERLICLPAMAARYAPRDTLGALFRQYRAYGTFRVRTACRHPASLRRQHLVAPMLVADAVLTVAGPRPVRSVARLGAALYAGVLAREGIRALPRTRSRADAATVPVVLGTMHLAFGIGTWQGMARHGVPTSAIRSAMTGRLPTVGPAKPVHAPSLARLAGDPITS